MRKLPFVNDFFRIEEYFDVVLMLHCQENPLLSGLFWYCSKISYMIYIYIYNDIYIYIYIYIIHILEKDGNKSNSI